tara:strand:+ start:184 stop:798 length:615 start_codon:yes stop_codon:yes gene_type:complete
LSKNKTSKNWINKQKRDIYVRKSLVEGYRSRAAYKLKEIDEKFKIIKNGIYLIDLGAAPGSWSQYVNNKSKNSKILATDLLKIKKIENIRYLEGDFTEFKTQEKIRDHFDSKIDVVLSDMAANTTGNKNIDSIKTGELCKEAIFFAKDILKLDGKLVAKLFIGSVFNEIIKIAKETFKEIKIYKPKASRKESKESYLICRYLRN